MDLISFLRRNGMNQTALAKALGVTSANVSKYCAGTGVPSYEVCKKLLVMGISVKELFDIDYVDPLTKPQEQLSPGEIVRRGLLELAEMQRAVERGREDLR